MAIPLAAVREVDVHFHGNIFRVELRTPRPASGTVFLLRDDGNIVGGRALVSALREQGLATAVCQLLTPAEREYAALRRRMPVRAELLALRMNAVLDTLGGAVDPGNRGIAVSGTAAEAALLAATFRPLAFDAIVCRHARFACERPLQHVRASTLFLAVAGDVTRIRPMTRAFQQLQCAKHFEIVAGASPAFDDAVSFGVACELTAAWMRKHLGQPHSTSVSSAITAMPHAMSIV